MTSKFLLTVVVYSLAIFQAASSQDIETCLKRLVEGTQCIRKIDKSRPINRYTCNDVNGLWECDGSRVDEECPQEVAQLHKFYEQKTLRELFPNGQTCQALQIRVTRPSQHIIENNCDDSELLNMNFAITTCGSILKNLDIGMMLRNPCIAVENFLQKCAEPNLRLCVKPGTLTYDTLKLARMAGFVESLASSSENNTLTIRNCGNPNSFLYQVWLQVTGSRNAQLNSVNDFIDVSGTRYFGMDLRSRVRSMVRSGRWPSEITTVLPTRMLIESLKFSLSALTKPDNRSRRRRDGRK